VKFRDWVAVAAHFRRGGAMKHKNAPRGGARNQSRELIDQGTEEYQEEEKELLRTERSIKEIRDAVQERHPELEILIDSSERPEGTWWMDVYRDPDRGPALSVVYEPAQKRFGLYPPGVVEGYGTKPYEGYQDVALLIRRVLELLD
jgi:hypothetical protein